MMPIKILRSPEEERREVLIEGALHWILAPDRSELPSGPKTQQTRRAIEEMCDDYNAHVREAAASPKFSEARTALETLAPKADELAHQFREHAGELATFGMATDNPPDPPDIVQAKRDEIADFKALILNEANVLDDIAERLIARLARWPHKKSGRGHIEGNVFGSPETQLAISAGRLYLVHRSMEDFHTSDTGGFFQLVCLLFQIATGRKPTTAQLFAAVRIAVKALKQQ